MNFSVVLLLLMVALMWQNASAQYGTPCKSPENLDGKCVPIPSCANLDKRLKEIAISKGSVSPGFRRYLLQSKCGLFGGEHHVCCVQDQIQYNPKSMQELRDLNCGNYIDPQIFNGKEVRPWSRPWMALLKYTRLNQERFDCGGTLISNRHVLTAAHCVAGHEHELKKVRLGEHKISNETDCRIISEFRKKCFKAIDVDIEKVYIHEGYKIDGYFDDIALLRLKTPVDLKGDMRKFISPICLPITKKLEQSIDQINEFFVTGWGATEKNRSSDILLETRVNKTKQEDCSNIYDLNMRDSQICVGGFDSKDSCSGDSGGPLLAAQNYIRPVIRLVQFGIVSLGVTECGTPGYPGIYTNIAHYMQWITDKMALN